MGSLILMNLMVASRTMIDLQYMQDENRTMTVLYMQDRNFEFVMVHFRDLGNQGECLLNCIFTILSAIGLISSFPSILCFLNIILGFTRT